MLVKCTLKASVISSALFTVLLLAWISKILDDLQLFRELSSLIRSQVLLGLPLLVSKFSEKYRFLASLVALFAWFLARLNCWHMAWSFVEIAFFLRTSLLRILSNNSLVIHGDLLLRILVDFSGACLSKQLTNRFLLCINSLYNFAHWQEKCMYSHSMRLHACPLNWYLFKIGCRESPVYLCGFQFRSEPSRWALLVLGPS